VQPSRRPWPSCHHRAVRLYHATFDDQRMGIERDGFAVSNVGDSKGTAWFCGDRDEAVWQVKGCTWLVVVEVSSHEVDHYRLRFPNPDGTVEDDPLGRYQLPWDFVNSYRPFTYEAV
jgi:hypothetical protein